MPTTTLARIFSATNVAYAVGLVVFMLLLTGIPPRDASAVIPAAAVAAAARTQAAAVPFTAISSCVIQVAASPAAPASVSSRITAAGCTVGTSSEFFKVGQVGTVPVCLGDADTDNALSVGSDCWPICRDPATCMEDVTSVPFKISGSYLRSTGAAVTMFLLIGNSPSN